MENSQIYIVSQSFLFSVIPHTPFGQLFSSSAMQQISVVCLISHYWLTNELCVWTCYGMREVHDPDLK